MSTIQTPADEAVTAAITPIKDARDQLLKREDELRTELGDIRRKIVHYEKFLRLAGDEVVDSRLPGRKVRGRTTSKHGNKAGNVVAQWRLDKVKQLLADSPPMTVEDISQALAWQTATTRVAMGMLREREEVRFAGKGETRGRPSLWTVYE